LVLYFLLWFQDAALSVLAGGVQGISAAAAPAFVSAYDDGGFISPA